MKLEKVVKNYTSLLESMKNNKDRWKEEQNWDSEHIKIFDHTIKIVTDIINDLNEVTEL